MSEVKQTELFLKRLLKRTKIKIMKKLSVNFKSSDTMKFDVICVLVIKEAQKAKRQNMIKSLINKKAVRELIQQQKISLKSNHIIIQINKILSSVSRKLLEIEEEKKKMKFMKKKEMKKTDKSDTDSKLDALTKQMKSLVLAVNIIKKDQAVLKQN